ncbi:diguanylate cyclase, partial [Klebsiella pneumoniae]|uniref:diguanylate cyclase domain-containing protein n=1 Tax=Klebsiella pneumoniae TaxID=573 RepID=UPI00200E62B6
VLLPGIDVVVSEKGSSEIYSQVRNMTLRDGLTEIGQVDVSIGIASYPQHTQSDSLLRAADAALYRAKELGRSRIVSFGRLKTS